MEKKKKSAPRKIKVTVHKTKSAKQLAPKRGKYVPKWCECKKSEFDNYADDNCCPCGIGKHHVHCRCGGVLQVG